MGAAEDIFADIDEKNKKRSGFGAQLAEGIVHSGTLGYRGEDAPSDLPLTGKVGRFAGEMIGFAPALEVGGGSATAVGLTGLAKELGVGALYGMAEKPEDAQATILDRMKQGAKTAVGFGVGYGVMKGAGRLAKRAFGPDELDTLLAKGAEGKGPPKEALMIEDQRFHMPDERRPPPPGSGPFDMPDQGGFTSRKALPPPKELGTPEDLTRAMEMESSLGRETAGQPEIPRDPFAKTPMQEATLSRQRSVSAEEQIANSKMYEAHVNSWAKDLVRQVPPEADMLEKHGKLAVNGAEVEDAAIAMMHDSVKHAVGETPIIEDHVVDALTPKAETRAALEQNIDAIVMKNEMPIEVVQAGTKMAEPINYWMSKGMNFDDAAELADNIVARAKMPFDETKVAEEASNNVIQKLTAARVPEWTKIKKRSFTPSDVVDLFYNVPIKGPEAIKYGLIELQPATGGLHLTEKGYAFVKQYNPEGLSGVFPDFMDRKILGAIRGQGYSNLSLSDAELKSAGLKMGSKRALQEGFIRPSTKGGKEIPGEYQLESKGAGMLAGGRGANANVALKEFDLSSGLRALPGDAESIAAKSAERERNKLLFGDLWEQTENLGKKC
jgi:hypothetical protein